MELLESSLAALSTVIREGHRTGMRRLLVLADGLGGTDPGGGLPRGAGWADHWERRRACGAVGAAAGAGPEATGAALWKHLQAEKYTSWKMWPGKTALYQGTEPHGVLLTTYVNGAALGAIEGKKGTMPAGAVVVKENYMPDKMLAEITVMYEVAGYDPAGGDWFWVKYTPDGKVEGEGKVGMCPGCHGKAANNDYLFTGALKEELGGRPGTRGGAGLACVRLRPVPATPPQKGGAP